MKPKLKLQKLVAKSENLNIIGSFVALEVALPENKFKYMTVTFKRGSKTQQHLGPIEHIPVEDGQF